MKNITKILAPFALLASVSVQADIIGGNVEVSYWYAGVSGTSTVGAAHVDMEGDLKFENDSFFEVIAAIEHPVPVIPNVKVKYASLDQTESGSLPRDSYGRLPDSV